MIHVLPIGLTFEFIQLHTLNVLEWKNKETVNFFLFFFIFWLAIRTLWFLDTVKRFPLESSRASNNRTFYFRVYITLFLLLCSMWLETLTRVMDSLLLCGILENPYGTNIYKKQISKGFHYCLVSFIYDVSFLPLEYFSISSMRNVNLFLFHCLTEG